MKSPSRYLLTIVLLSTVLGSLADLLWAQDVQYSKTALEQPGGIIDFRAMTLCIEDIPAPTMMNEPRFTKGDSNIIAFKLPELTALPFPPDTISNPFVITHVLGGTSGEPKRFPRPVDLFHADQVESVLGLQEGILYGYTASLFLPVCKVDCDAVADSSDLEVHCSAFQDTVWSVQDLTEPTVSNLRIPELEASRQSGWWHESTFEIAAALEDQAGLWQAFLYRRACDELEWEPVADTIFVGTLTDFGYTFDNVAEVTILQTKADGCYEFRVEGKDASHTPESAFPDFRLAGNSHAPTAGDQAHISLKIDTRAPNPVALACEQDLNRILLSWSEATDPAPGIGLQGYRLYRDDRLVATLSKSDTKYTDEIDPALPDHEFTYRIQPFDSLDNVQIDGGAASCLYLSTPSIEMAAEPDFTPADSNRVCWRSSIKIDAYAVFAAENGDFVNPIRADVQDTCYTFKGLLDGARYDFWVEAIDNQNRTILSDTVRTVQDATPPEIGLFEIENMVQLAAQRWVTDRQLVIRLFITDASPGEIRQIAVLENDLPISTMIFGGHLGVIDTTMSYVLNSVACVPGELAVMATDRAGNSSAPRVVAFKLDDMAPPTVSSLICSQLQQRNGVGLSWPPSMESSDCSGLAGYRLFRDRVLIAILPPWATSYTDIVDASTPTGTFEYAVQPYDSLGNEEALTTTTACDYVGVPTIVLQDFPEFVRGTTAQICWTSSNDLRSLTIFSDSQAADVQRDSVLIDSPPQGQSCHLLSGLKSDTIYQIWLRGIDLQARPVLTDTFRLIPDNSPPIIHGLELVDGELSNDRIWVYSRDIRLRILAEDAPPGELWTYAISENGAEASEFGFADSSSTSDEIAAFSLRANTDQSTQITIRVTVADGAGNESESSALTFHLQDEQPSLFAFPNPYNPRQGTVTIRFQDINEIKVRIYDFFGNLVRTLDTKANNHDFIWDGRNGKGQLVANGGYICVGTNSKVRFKIGVTKRRL